MPSYLRQWFIHRHGGNEPVTRLIRNGIASNGSPYRSYNCSNNSAGCDFFETVFDNQNTPSIPITEEMTAQKIEEIREVRRKANNPAATNNH